MQTLHTLLLCATFFMFSSLSANAQTTLSGTVRDTETGEPLFAANVVILQDGKIIAGTETDFDGKFTITSLAEGVYDIRSSYTGMEEVLLKKMPIKMGKTNFVNIEMEGNIVCHYPCYWGYRNPLIDLDNPTSGQAWTGREVSRLPIK
jgi:Carboxypeptidase regulatory-like domain